MSRSRVTKPSLEPATGLVFLLTQVGAHAAARFAERLAPLKLAPPHAGILWGIKQADGLSQQALGEKLGMYPSRLVLILDELEQRGFVERRDRETDRRSYALHLTEAGAEILEQIGRITRENQEGICAALDEAERVQLKDLLSRIAAEQQLTLGVHPGYRKLGGAQPK
ncbi:DNA-binding transcriptional regulator, MarR family [Singulisphaera sp. GP187]|uniref:MarR family winged helix-turn-helix transcriptional regulator n=1 Tax=Singulisphaera sp. GP187 TaxID=1882752 RepID=UPI00092CA406|nr:MarR family transcriptional regulator [Singulisphaera sp. GP187]SIO57950.1 DNA-binding transcriptional regulator, MarR family [Singulisphaera sp. GP187]